MCLSSLSTPPLCNLPSFNKAQNSTESCNFANTKSFWSNRKQNQNSISSFVEGDEEVEFSDWCSKWHHSTYDRSFGVLNHFGHCWLLITFITLVIHVTRVKNLSRFRMNNVKWAGKKRHLPAGCLLSVSVSYNLLLTCCCWRLTHSLCINRQVCTLS